MKTKQIAAAAAAALMAFSAVSCGTSILKNDKIKNKNSDSKAPTESVSAVTELSSSADSAADPAEGGTPSGDIVYTQTNFDAVEVPYTEYSKTYQAESGTLKNDTVTVKNDRPAFKGDGYISGADLENYSLSFDLPESQFYNITIQTAADSAKNCRLFINGAEVWIFRTSGEGVFSEKNLENIWLEEGINEITLTSTENAVDVDYIKIEANKDISTLAPDLSQAKLSNPNADYHAKALYSLLCSNYGKQILTAQHVTAGDNAETELVKTVTDKYPAIRAVDIGGYTQGNPKDINKMISYVKEKGGIAAYDWYWTDPTHESKKFEISEMDFDIKKAVPETVIVEETPDEYPDDLNEDQQSAGSQASQLTQKHEQLKYPIEEMALWTSDEIEEYHTSGEITDECYYILKDIDKISAKLTVLKENYTAVLFRPLPVASNGFYWWGLDKESYKWLWKLMYTRMTEYHELTNLVWVWSAQNADWYVGDEYCDVLSVDVYTDGNRDAQINTLLFLDNICRTKPLAMSECSNLPAMESVLQEKALWSYTSLWNGDYLLNETGAASSDIEQAAQLSGRFKEYYNNNYTLTLDELPDLKDVAKSIKKQEKAEAKKNKKDD